MERRALVKLIEDGKFIGEVARDHSREITQASRQEFMASADFFLSQLEKLRQRFDDQIALAQWHARN